jgi:hypothetical protein
MEHSFVVMLLSFSRNVVQGVEVGIFSKEFSSRTWDAHQIFTWENIVREKFTTVVDMKGRHMVLWSLEALYVVTGESHRSCVSIVHTCLLREYLFDLCHLLMHFQCFWCVPQTEVSESLLLRHGGLLKLSMKWSNVQPISFNICSPSSVMCRSIRWWFLIILHTQSMRNCFTFLKN